MHARILLFVMHCNLYFDTSDRAYTFPMGLLHKSIVDTKIMTNL